MMEQTILDWLEAGQAKWAVNKQTHLLNVLKDSIGELVVALSPPPLVQVETIQPADPEADLS